MSDGIHELDLVVVGAGPAGVALVSEARAAGVAPERIVVLEKAETHSFVIRRFYPEGKPVQANYKGIAGRCEGVLCIPDLSREETITYLDRAIRDSGVAVRYREEVHRLAGEPDGRLSVESSGGTFIAPVVVIAIGILGRPNKLPVPVPRDVQKRVLYDLTSEELAGLDVLVVGGGDTATEYVQFLVQRSNRVALSYRGAELSRPNPINRESVLALAGSGRLTIHWQTNVQKLLPDQERVRVHFDHTETAPVVVDRVVVALGGTTPENFLKAAGIEFDGPTPRHFEGGSTNIPGLYLAGDLTAGRSGGSIIMAFNSAARAMQRICEKHGICSLR